MHRFALAGVLPVLFTAAGGAQTPTVLTEAEFLSVLDRPHPAVVGLAEAVARAEARVLDSAALENPLVGAIREDPAGSVRQTEVVVAWQLPDAGRGPTVEAREWELEASRARFTVQLLSLRLAMRETFADWSVATARQRRLMEAAVRVETLARRQADRFENGEASGLEAHRLRLAASALHSRLALATAETERARAEAARWYPELATDVVPALPALSEAPSIEATDPRVRAAEADLAAAKLERRVAGRFVATPQLSLGWQRQVEGPEASGGPILGVAWSVPLFDRKRAARLAADASLEAAQARLDLLRRQVSASRVAGLASYAGLSSALMVMRQELAVSERMLDGAEAAFRHGEASLTDFLDTLRSATEAELALLDLHEAALAAHRELERLAGPGSTSRPSMNDDSFGSASQENLP